MQKKTNKKGFTIVELVIVIAVIAILAAVLIPTFATLTKKANMSADQQAVRQMNTVLAAEGAVEKNTLFDVYDALAENGFDAEDYKPLTKGTAFVWDASLDRILHVSDDFATIYSPDEYKDMSEADRGDWHNLVNTPLEAQKPENYSDSASEIKVSNAAEFVYVVEKFNEGKTTAETLTINLDGKVIDMKGTALTIANEEQGRVTKDVVLKNGTIKNINAVDAAYVASNGVEGNDGMYTASALFGILYDGASVTIEDVTLENVNIRNTHVSGASFLVANAGGGTTVIKNVTIKDSTLIAHRNAGALVGNITDGTDSTVTLAGDIVLDNVQVKTVGGRSGLLIGFMTDSKVNEAEGLKITLKNGSAYSIYECEQNTGTFEGQTLGLDTSDNTLYSYAYNNGSNALETKKFFAGAYATESQGTNKTQVKYEGFNSYVTVE